jgi:hypothetical protein
MFRGYGGRFLGISGIPDCVRRTEGGAAAWGTQQSTLSCTLFVGLNAVGSRRNRSFDVALYR